MNIKHFWKPITWLAIICYGLFIPANELPTKPFINFPHFDKFVHAFLFFVLSLLLFRPYKKLNLKYYFFAPATALFFGALLESVQRFLSSSRSSDFYDFIANLSGIVLSVFFYRFLVRNKKWEILF
jgi:VanZ family protein